MEKFDTVLYEKKAGVATLTLHRPDSFNAFTPLMNKEIIAAVTDADRDIDVRCIVITGAGRAFCAGEDIGNVDEHTNHATFLRERYHPMVKALRVVSKPTIAAVNGVAAGAGMSLALLCDFRLVHHKTKFVSAFMEIGLIPDSGFIYVLPRLVGYAKALEIATLGRPISGKEAFEFGLATELVEFNEWDDAVAAFSGKIAGMPTKAFSLVKRYMMDSMHLPFEEALEQEAQAQRIAGLTEDHQEGLQAFREKRKPKFVGK